MRIVFMGTPDIAEAALGALLGEGHEVVAVYTRIDKPQGRKQVVTPSPVKARAVENRIPVVQPPSMKKDPQAAARQLAEFAPELCVVVAYGLILPPEVLAVPTHGCINLHVSLLPQYRGAAPIQWAVIHGQEKTGVSIMQLDEGLDTGPVLAMQEVEIGSNDTAGDVFERVTGIGARLLAQTVNDIEAGKAKALPQQGEASYAPQLDKQMARIDFARPAKAVHNLVRGCNPWPLAWFESGGKRIKVRRTARSGFCSEVPGRILSCQPLTVACGEEALVLEHVVPEGARAMTGAEWAAGRRFQVGDSVL